MENKEIFYIEESQTWMCPKAGRYKVICVGGGASGSYTFPGGTVPIIQGSGGTTSFGAILSAEGGVIPESGGFPGAATSSVSFCSGENGYDGVSYGDSCSIGWGANSSWGVGGNARLSTQGRGYGASGGASAYKFNYTHTSGSNTNPQSTVPTPFTTPCGEIKSTIVDMEEGQNVFCTIGKGGVPVPLEGTPLLAALKEISKNVTSITTTAEGMLKTVASGKDGVIIIQYLGA